MQKSLPDSKKVQIETYERRNVIADSVTLASIHRITCVYLLSDKASTFSSIVTVISNIILLYIRKYVGRITQKWHLIMLTCLKTVF